MMDRHVHELTGAACAIARDGRRTVTDALVRSEMDKLQRDLKTVESRYGEDVLQLVIASGYLSKLVGNREIKRCLDQHHPEILTEFRAIISATSLDHDTSSNGHLVADATDE